jgi:hypothetical protein
MLIGSIIWNISGYAISHALTSTPGMIKGNTIGKTITAITINNVMVPTARAMPPLANWTSLGMKGAPAAKRG